MKRIAISTLLMLWGVIAVQAQTQSPNGSEKETLARIEWKNKENNFGKIEKDKPAIADFTFVNTGSVPLLISEAKGTCGCTVTDYPKNAIAPGESGVIKATYNAAHPGAFNKTVTVTSNSTEGKSILTLKGEVN